MLEAEDLILCLKHALRQPPTNLLGIWDGSPIHRGQVVKDFLTSRADSGL
jgi:hypothetical protein